MPSIRQKIYWKAPYFVKNWMASLNARRLDRDRYGSVYRQTVGEISERDKWSADQFFRYQCQQLSSMIRHAATKVPYYRKIFSEGGIDPQSITKPEHLGRLPILEKEVIRSESKSLVDETLDMRKLLIAHTSGTTGTPLDIYTDMRTESTIYAYVQARHHGVAGMRKRTNQSVSICGHLVAAPGRVRPPFWVYNRRWKQLYMSSYHLSTKYLSYYVDELHRYKADYIEGYPSSVYAIAQYILENKLEPVPFKACFTTSEILFDYHRVAIRNAFGCRTYNQYGSAETVVFSAECPAGTMHISPEVGVVEIVDDDDQPVEPGRTGQLVCTGLVNRVQPFIRYRIGDVGSISANPCPCGSPLPALGSLKGRIDTVLVTRDGRRIGRLDPVFKGAHGVIEAQIVQDDYDIFRVRIVPGNNYTQAEGNIIATNLAHRVGKADIRIELVDHLERTAGGKFRAVICNLANK